MARVGHDAAAGLAVFTPTAYTAEFWSPIVASFFFVSTMALTTMLAKRIPRWGSWLTTPPARLAVVLLLTDSLAFVFTSGLLTLGLGTSRNLATCNVAIWLCIVFYGSTKLIIIVFLMERVHMVHSMFTPRHKSKLYILNCSVELLWIGVFVGLILVHKTTIRQDEQCAFFLSPQTLFVAAGLEICLNFWFSLLFAVPLWRGAFANPVLRCIAIKSLVGAGVSMTSSVTNLVIISSFHGYQLSWVCFCSCTLDVVVNACAFFFITHSETASDYMTAASKSGGYPPLPAAIRFTLDEQQTASRRLSEYQAYTREISNAPTSDTMPCGVRDVGEGAFGKVAVGMEGLPSEKAWVEMGDDPSQWRGDAVGIGTRLTRHPSVRSAV